MTDLVARGASSSHSTTTDNPMVGPSNPDATTSSSQASEDSSSKLKQAYVHYAKVLGGGTFATVILIFAIFSIYWGSLHEIPVRNLHGWLIDFDGGIIGQQVTQGLTSNPNPAVKITWHVLEASQFSTLENVRNEVFEEKVWVALTINPGASSRLQASLTSPNASYDGSEAISVFASEARNENAFRSIIRPSVQASLDILSKNAALQIAKQASSNPNIATLLSTSPQTLTQPIYYRIINIIPFDESLATAVIFVGLIYQVILSFFVVNIGLAARQVSGLEHLLPLRKLIALRMGSSILAYFLLSLFYCLLSVAFQLDLNRKFGHAGFMVFWMLNFVGMLALGLALEAMLTLLTIRFIAFFMLTWIITNISVVIFPLEILPTVYRYGYGAPFYNISKAMRTIIFGTKNEVGMRFGILFVWVAISCVTLPLFMFLGRRSEEKQARSATPEAQWEEQRKTLDEKTA